MSHVAKKIFTSITAMVCLAVSVQAQTDSINIVSTAVPFLRISPDARAGGMGDLAIATSPDATILTGVSECEVSLQPLCVVTISWG